MFLLAKYWEHAENRRKFFLDFARDHKFDPLVAKNWYSVSNELVRATRVFKFCVFALFY